MSARVYRRRVAAGPWSRSGVVEGFVGAEHRGGDVQGHPARGRRHQGRGALLLAVEARHDRREPRTGGEAQAERLAEADPAQPVGVHARLPGREQPATQVPGVVGARVGHREAEVGDQVAEHRHHRRHHDRHDRQQGHDQQQGPPGRLLGGLVQLEVVPQAQRVEDLAPGADHGRGDDHPGGGERGVPEPPRLEPGDQPRVVRSLGGLAYLGRDGPVQQVAAQRVRRVHADAVEGQLVVAELGGGARADPDGGQPQHPVDQRGADVDGADAVDRRRQHVLVEQAPPQLHPPLEDAEAGGQVPRDAEGDRHADAQHVPPPLVPARA